MPHLVSLILDLNSCFESTQFPDSLYWSSTKAPVWRSRCVDGSGSAYIDLSARQKMRGQAGTRSQVYQWSDQFALSRNLAVCLRRSTSVSTTVNRLLVPIKIAIRRGLLKWKCSIYSLQYIFWWLPITPPVYPSMKSLSFDPQPVLKILSYELCNVSGT